MKQLTPFARHMMRDLHPELFPDIPDIEAETRKRAARQRWESRLELACILILTASMWIAAIGSLS